MLSVIRNVEYKGMSFRIYLDQNGLNTTVTVKNYKSNVSYQYTFDYRINDLQQLIIDCIKDFYVLITDNPTVSNILEWDGEVREESVEGGSEECCSDPFADLVWEKTDSNKGKDITINLTFNCEQIEQEDFASKLIDIAKKSGKF